MQDCVDLLESHDCDVDVTEIDGSLAGLEEPMDAVVSDGGSEAVICWHVDGVWMVTMLSSSAHVDGAWDSLERVREEVREWLDSED